MKKSRSASRHQKRKTGHRKTQETARSGIVQKQQDNQKKQEKMKGQESQGGQTTQNDMTN